jgi:hypothetical protein
MSFDDQERLEEQMTLWGEPDEEGRGEFILQRLDDVKVESNFSFSSAPKP